MVDAIEDLPAGILGFRLEGEVGEKDLRALLPTLREAAATGAARVLFVSAPGFDGSQVRSMIGSFEATVGAELDQRDWKRVAIVTHSRLARYSHRVWGHLVPVETKVFSGDDEPAARAWLAED